MSGPGSGLGSRARCRGCCWCWEQGGVGVGVGGGVGGRVQAGRRACSSGSAQSRALAGPDARLPWTVAHSQPTGSKVSHSQPPCSKASSCASTPGLPRLLGGQALSSLGGGAAASAAATVAAAGASTDSVAAAVAGKEVQEASDDAAGSSSGGSETDRLPVRCGAAGSVQIAEAAHPSPSADHAKRPVQGAVAWVLAGQAARGL